MEVGQDQGSIPRAHGSHAHTRCCSRHKKTVHTLCSAARQPATNTSVLLLRLFSTYRPCSCTMCAAIDPMAAPRPPAARRAGSGQIMAAAPHAVACAPCPTQQPSAPACCGVRSGFGPSHQPYRLSYCVVKARAQASYKQRRQPCRLQESKQSMAAKARKQGRRRPRSAPHSQPAAPAQPCVAYLPRVLRAAAAAASVTSICPSWNMRSSASILANV